MPAFLWIVLMILFSSQAQAYNSKHWVMGLELGELPLEGSFKLGANIGYRFSRQHELFISYQIPDKVKRDGHSFNADSTGLKGLTSSTESVSKRAQLLGIWRGQATPFYLSYGLVYNGQDREHMKFKELPRQVNNQLLQEPLSITVTRPSGFAPALGIGVSWLTHSGTDIFIQWSGNIFQKAVTPEIKISSPEINSATRQQLKDRISNNFRNKITNVYHVFSLGIRY